MLNLEEILQEWKKESVIDEMALDEASRQAGRLHSKYLEMLMAVKLSLKKKELEQKVLLRDKWLYYSGKMTKEEMDERKWPYDPFKGLKIMKSDMDYYFNADEDLQKVEERITYFKTTIEALEEIMGSLKWRSQTIKNMIQWRQFVSGNG